MQHQETNTISGKELGNQIQVEVTDQIKKLKLIPGLAVVLIGNDPASERYVSIKQKAALNVGIVIHVYRLNEAVTEEEVLQTIDWLNKDKEVHAILIQLPLPNHLDEDKIIAAMDPKKDVDGFHPENIKAFLADSSLFAPGLVMGIIQLIAATNEPLPGKQAVIVAKSEEFTKTLEHALEPFEITSTLVHPDAPELLEKVHTADIIITAVGKPHWLTQDMIREGAIIIDVGTKDVSGKITGDVDLSCWNTASWISPVPGGVGPMTVAMLLKHTVLLARLSTEQNKN
ncbi:hypothetical protein BK004_02415 [bacterium CG10_46_32]|nr:MAG: hypothetical protein BK004_02415 [bacterium CG10_46_32]PIR56167.1 MAG: bifunctional methylenetetrahydrofolate dehydrogenase/methenyltetrahydrofolate cyclohydrolase [Parcubacteria group bacterium CG10_big_fil_rev_8_21_14_0_10_46_32]